MNKSKSNKGIYLILFFGLLGCICFGGSDWLMIYGDTSFEGELVWLTKGVAQAETWRNSLAMILSFPGIVFYLISLLGISKFINESKERKVYESLTALGFTPWLSIHLFYIMIFYTFAFLQKAGEKELSFEVCEGIFAHLSWILPIGQVFMLLPFFYWFVLVLRKKTIFSKWMAISNPLIIYIILKASTAVMPDVPFRLAFTNGLMSESMFIWFIIFMFALIKVKKDRA